MNRSFYHLLFWRNNHLKDKGPQSYMNGYTLEILKLDNL